MKQKCFVWTQKLLRHAFPRESIQIRRYRNLKPFSCKWTMINFSAKGRKSCNTWLSFHSSGEVALIPSEFLNKQWSHVSPWNTGSSNMLGQAACAGRRRGTTITISSSPSSQHHTQNAIHTFLGLELPLHHCTMLFRWILERFAVHRQKQNRFL